MIHTVVGQAFEALLWNAPLGLGTSLTVRVYDPSNGDVIIASFSEGITEPQPGSYRVGLTLEPPGTFVVRWQWPGNYAEEEVFVAIAPPAGTSDYTSIEALNKYLGIVLSNEEASRALDRAMDDVDHGVGPRPLTSSGRKFNPFQMSRVQALMLAKAVHAQVEYRLEMGEPFMVEDQYDARGGRDYSSSGKLRKLNPKAMSYLHAGGLLNLSVGGGGWKDVTRLPNQNT